MANFDPFEKEFRRQAGGLRRTPASRSWNRIERRLDQRKVGGGRILGIRPWMIAALLLLVAGTTVISKLADDRDNPLAQRSEFIEELSTPYTPMEDFDPVEYLNGAPDTGEEIVRDADFRDVVVAREHRVNG